MSEDFLLVDSTSILIQGHHALHWLPAIVKHIIY